jgi:hypothetical protein
MLELAMAVWGVIVLFTGRLKVSSTKVVEGTAARLLGLLMLAPLPIAFMVGIAVGIWAGANGRAMDDIRMPLLASEVGIVIITAIIVFSIAHAIGKPPGQQQLPLSWQPNQYPPNQYPPPGPPADPNNPYHPPRF